MATCPWSQFLPEEGAWGPVEGGSGAGVLEAACSFRGRRMPPDLCARGSSRAVCTTTAQR